MCYPKLRTFVTLSPNSRDSRAVDYHTKHNLQSAIALALACATWPRGAIPADFKQPVASNTPVLLLSGEDDPVTPPANAEQAARTLPNSLQLVAPGQGHNIITRGCLPHVAADFVASGAIAGLDSACVKDIRPMPFFVSFSGPEP